MTEAASSFPERTARSAALKDAAITGLLALGVFLPLIGFQTVQSMNNELVLRTRWPLLAAVVGAVVALRLLVTLVIAPLRAGAHQRQRAYEKEAATETPSRLQEVARRGILALGALVCLGGIALLGRALFIGRALVTNPTAGMAFTVFSGVLLAAFVGGIGIVLLRGGRQGLASIARFAAPAGIGFLVVFPIIAILAGGWSGTLKWIDNFGIQILIYVMLGWGLNIVVGLAGLLDLGYVAFYAVGAYSSALLATNFGLSFWLLLPLAGILAAFWGILLGFPVLRLRGDYLAIVTLAFGEIIRLVLINWVPVTKGYAGIGGIPRPSFFGLRFDSSPDGFAAFFGLDYSPVHRAMFLYYLILGLALLTALVTVRFRRLPVGRAWEALREDEIACRSLGINTTNTKLTAFAMGAMLAGFAGAFFSARQGFISPESFTFMESATILAIVVLGGMGSQIGVAIAAITMIGGTEIMRDFGFLKTVFGPDFDPAQYRMLVFGFAMVLIMVWKPRGFVATRTPTVFLKERKTVDADLVREGRG